MKRVLKEKNHPNSANSRRRVAQGKFPQNAAQDGIAARIDNSPLMLAQRKKLQSLFGGAAQLQEESAPKPNRSGLPDNLKSGIEHLSGMSGDMGTPVAQRKLVPIESEERVFRDDRDTGTNPLKFKLTEGVDTYMEVGSGRIFEHNHFDDQFRLRAEGGEPTFLDTVSHRLMVYDGQRVYKSGEECYSYQNHKYQKFDPNTTYYNSVTGLDYRYDPKNQYYYAYDTSGCSYSYCYDPHTMVYTHYYWGDTGWYEFNPRLPSQTEITLGTDTIPETDTPPEIGITPKINTGSTLKRKRSGQTGGGNESPKKKKKLSKSGKNLKSVGNMLNKSGGYHTIFEDTQDPERYVIRRRKNDGSTPINQGMDNLGELMKQLGDIFDQTQLEGVIRVPEVSKYDDDSYRVERINDTANAPALWNTYRRRKPGWEIARNKLYAIRAVCMKNLNSSRSGRTEKFPDFRPANVGDKDGELIYLDFDQPGEIQEDSTVLDHIEQWAGRRYRSDPGGERAKVESLFCFLSGGEDSFAVQGDVN